VPRSAYSVRLDWWRPAGPYGPSVPRRASARTAVVRQVPAARRPPSAEAVGAHVDRAWPPARRLLHQAPRRDVTSDADREHRIARILRAERALMHDLILRPTTRSLAGPDWPGG